MTKSASGNMSLALYVFALILLTGGSYHLIRQIATYGYETTTGTILSHRWEKNRLPSQPGFYDQASVWYAYSVAGKQYRNNRIGFGFDFFSTFTFMEELKFWKYPVGSGVEVYVQKDSPERSVLERGITAPVIFELILGVLLFYWGKSVGKNKVA